MNFVRLNKVNDFWNEVFSNELSSLIESNTRGDYCTHILK